MFFRLVVSRRRCWRRGGRGSRRLSYRSRTAGTWTRCRKNLSKTSASFLWIICDRFFGRHSAKKSCRRPARDRGLSDCRSPPVRRGLLDFDAVRLREQPETSVLYLSHDCHDINFSRSFLNGVFKPELCFCSSRRYCTRSSVIRQCVLAGSQFKGNNQKLRANG